MHKTMEIDNTVATMRVKLANAVFLLSRIIAKRKAIIALRFRHPCIMFFDYT